MTLVQALPSLSSCGFWWLMVQHLIAATLGSLLAPCLEETRVGTLVFAVGNICVFLHLH